MPGGGTPDRAGVTRLITEAILEGRTQNATMRFGREMGLRFGNEAFRDIWHAQAGIIANREQIAGAYPDLPLPDSLHTVLRGKGVDGFSYTTALMVRNPGDSEPGVLTWTINSDRPLTPAEAAAEAQQHFENGLVVGTEGYDTLMSITVIGAYRLEA